MNPKTDSRKGLSAGSDAAAHKCCLGLHIDLERLIAAVVDGSGDVITRAVSPWEPILDKQNIFQIINDFIEINLTSSSFLKKEQPIVGIGIGCSKHVIELLPGCTFQQFKSDLMQALSSKLNVPIFVESDILSMATGEYQFGQCRNKENFLCVSMGSDISATLFQNGKENRIWRSPLNALGHLAVVPHGPLCSCGQKGCLNTVASTKVILENVLRKLELGEESVLPELTGGDSFLIDEEMIYSAAKAGDSLSVKVLTRAIEYFALGIANIILVYNPFYIVLEGNFSTAGTYVSQLVEKHVNEIRKWDGESEFVILTSNFGNYAVAIGAAALALRENSGCRQTDPA